MEYAVGHVGRVVVARFSDGENVLEGLKEIFRKEGFRGAAFHLVGGLKGGRFVVGPETEEMPPVPVWKSLSESHEAVGFGTIFPDGDEPKVHFHGTYGKKDSVKMGCLREESEVFLVLEAVIMELVGIPASRPVDPVSGMSLLKVG